MLIYEGIILKIIDEDRRKILCATLHGHGEITCNALFSSHHLEVGDYVLILVSGRIGYTEAYAIPILNEKDNRDEPLSNIKMFFMNNEIIIDKDKIEIKHDIENNNYVVTMNKDEMKLYHTDKCSITMNDDKISIKYGNNSTIELEPEKIKVKSNETQVTGNPQPSGQPKGGFSQILYCPFTGLPHTTDTLIQGANQ
jgi:hypothetical protein